jgi:hypothetical protein
MSILLVFEGRRKIIMMMKRKKRGKKREKKGKKGKKGGKTCSSSNLLHSSTNLGSQHRFSLQRDVTHRHRSVSPSSATHSKLPPSVIARDIRAPLFPTTRPASQYSCSLTRLYSRILETSHAAAVDTALHRELIRPRDTRR